ncbi:MAG: diaminopimelate epimerase [Bacteroidales bacterium]|nr:diaminopimelate epimerase [Bacteroidales bacterium]
MNKISFYKYQGAGNDFVMLDNRSGDYNELNAIGIAALCNRKYGVGADGVIMLEVGLPHSPASACGGILQMRYYNADGSEASFCGNGGRCFALFAHHLGLSKQCEGVALVTFVAGDGRHEAAVYSEKRIQISMRSVQSINVCNSHGNTLTVLDTGVPHGVVFTQSLNACNVIEDGRKIRNDKQFPDGVNVDFVERVGSGNIRLRTYERGVEDETDACGTGAVAAAIAAINSEYPSDNNPSGNNAGTTTNNSKEYLKEFGMYEVNVETKTATLKVYFTLDGGSAKNIILEGPVAKVFEGSITLAGNFKK